MPNRLSGETSPYLLQHAGNPVDWHPWDSEALALARSENKPILLSIGYSACHWCHVMAHECFEDADVAAAMNRHFVNIKVDREERPDLDQIYQTALYMLTRRPGGWPLTLFLTPEQKPFFGGTYFPRSARQGLPGFLDLLPRVAEAYHERGDEIERQSVSLLQAFANSLPSAEQAYAGFSQRPLDLALAGLQEQFDAADGGFGAAPKFLHPTKLEFCLRRHFTTGDTQALHMATHTLRRMAEGGLRDQLGGGFYRYSTDAHWSIPHFEKMLYDNGPLLSLYADAWLASGEPLFSQAAEETAVWIMREMEQPEGGYYSSLDADSENEEGRFYVWDRDQVAGILDHDEYAVLAPRYGLTRDPNFEGRHWHLEIARPLAEVSRAVGIDEDAALQRLASARAKLLAARALRVRAGRDEKILPAWNGLAIKGMAHAGSILGRDDWIHSAARATDFVRAALWRDGRLLASFKDGRAHLNGYLDDHAFMLDGVLELMQAQFRPSDLEFAIALADALLEHFEDRESGGFFFTSHDHEKLIHRPKPGIDNVMPSGNGMAAQALQRLGYLTGRFHYLEAAERALALFYPYACRNAASCCSFLAGVEQSLAPPVLVLLHGPATTVREWKSALRSRAPLALVFAPPPELNVPLPGLNWAAKAEHTAGARVCLGTRCLPEIADLRELLRVCEVRDNTSS